VARWMKESLRSLVCVNRRRPPADVKVARRKKFGWIANQIRISPGVQSRQQGNIYKAMPKSKKADKDAALYLDIMHCCPTQRHSGLYYFVMSAGQVFLNHYVDDITSYLKRPDRHFCNGHQLTCKDTSRCFSGLLTWLSSSWQFRIIPAESYWNSRIV
jgi:hypothetical protein